MDRQAQLAFRLYEKTMAGELEWKPSPRDDWYQVSFTQYSVRIGLKKGRQGDDVAIEVVNSIGDVADAFTDVTLDKKEDAPPEGLEGWYPALWVLYTRARRTALGADKAIDDILGELG